MLVYYWKYFRILGQTEMENPLFKIMIEYMGNTVVLIPCVKK